MRNMKKMLLPTVLVLCFALLTTMFASAAGGSGAPVAQNLELATYRSTSVGGRLSATDPNGDAVTFEITTEPTKGKIELDEDGHFVYTPADGKRGKDYFGYKAVDTDGNRSQEATVIIKIQKQSSKITYSDTKGKGSAYAAVRLAEEGIFAGQQLAGEYVFSPDQPVTREEFLAMCMTLAGKPTLRDVRSTGFADDADIDAWAKPYVSTALRSGIISGYASGDAGATFGPGEYITALEAAVILDRCVELTDAVTTWFGYDDYVPAWALQSASNVSACGLLPYGVSYADATLSRGETAEMLVAAMDVLSRR